MKKEIRTKRNEYRDKSIKLRQLALQDDVDSEVSYKLREKQDDQYKRFRFFDNFIKASERVKK